MYGRKWVRNATIVAFSSDPSLPDHQVLHLSNIFFAVFNLVCAFVPDAGALIAFRFLCMSIQSFRGRPWVLTILLAGYPGAGPVSIGGGCVADLFREEERASAMALYTLVRSPLFRKFRNSHLGHQGPLVVRTFPTPLFDLAQAPLLHRGPSSVRLR